METNKINMEKIDDERVLRTIGQNHLVADFCLIAIKKPKEPSATKSKE